MSKLNERLSELEAIYDQLSSIKNTMARTSDALVGSPVETQWAKTAELPNVPSHFDERFENVLILLSGVVREMNLDMNRIYSYVVEDAVTAVDAAKSANGRGILSRLDK